MRRGRFDEKFEPRARVGSWVGCERAEGGVAVGGQAAYSHLGRATESEGRQPQEVRTVLETHAGQRTRTRTAGVGGCEIEFWAGIVFVPAVAAAGF